MPGPPPYPRVRHAAVGAEKGKKKLANTARTIKKAAAQGANNGKN